jgi:hypothetical protein
MPTRTIQSPGVEINEIDLSLNQQLPTGTNVLLVGYAQQGPNDEILSVSTLGDFEQIYGTPTNAAERYLYHSAKQVFNSPANVFVGKLPYGEDNGDGFGNNYSALVYPVLAIPLSASISTPDVVAQTGTLLTQASAYYFGEPTHITMTDAVYNDIIAGNFTWSNTVGLSSTAFIDNDVSSLGTAGLIVINKAKLAVNESFEGYYIALADNSNFNPATEFNAVESVYSIDEEYPSGFVSVPSTRFGFELTSPAVNNIAYKSGSVSEEIENIPTFNIAGNSFRDTLTVGVYKLRPSIFSRNVTTLESVLQEGFVGSFNAQRKLQDINGGSPKSFFIQDVVNSGSNDIVVLVNPNISTKNVWSDSTGDNENPIRGVNVFKDTTSVDATHAPYLSAAQSYGWLAAANNLYTFSVFTPAVGELGSKNIGNIPQKLDRVLRLADNPDTLPLDVTIDAGLSTIWSIMDSSVLTNASLSSKGIYDDEMYVDVSSLSSTDGSNPTGLLYSGWKTVTDAFDTFARVTRKDHVFISDPLRHIFVQGKASKILDNKSNNFSQNVYWPIRNLYAGVNTNYSIAYANWARTYDSSSDTNVWVPFSGYLAGVFATTDNQVAPWSAPAGLNRGILSNLVDIAVNPNQKQRDLLYKINLNPIVFFPRDGFTVMGQKTLQVKPSAFDRINVRRLFLFLEKAVLNPTKYFVFEPNTVFTRSRLVNTITPVFELAKNTEGLYDYLIIADERNNTPDVIDRNELKVDIYVKPVRTAEFIQVNFYATRSGQDFNELI